MKTSRALALSGFAFAAAITGFADYNYWLGGDGAWSSAGKWLNGVPTAESPAQAFFAHGTNFSPSGERTSYVTMPPDAYVVQLGIGEPGAEVAGLTFPDSCAVTFKGPSTLHMQTRRYSSIHTGRELNLDGVDMVFDDYSGTGGDYGGLTISGRLCLKNSSLLSPSVRDYLAVGATARIVLDNSDLVAVDSSLVSGTTLLLKSGTAVFGTTYHGNDLYQTNVIVRDADVSFGALVNCCSADWLPCGTNGVLRLNKPGDSSTSLFQPKIVPDALFVMNGKLMMTNCPTYWTWATLSNNCTIAGRGMINTATLRVKKDVTVDFHMPTYGIFRDINAYGSGDTPTINFRNGGVFKMFDPRPGDSNNEVMAISTPVNFYGSVVFDYMDVYKGKKKRTTQNNFVPLFNDRSGVEYRNATSVVNSFGKVPVRFSHFRIGDGVTVTERNSNFSLWCYRRTHEFSIGENSVYTNADFTYARSVIDANGKVEADPSARLCVFGGKPSEETGVIPMFLSLADGPLPFTLNAANPREGYSVRWVGGCAYYSNGTKNYGTSALDGYWIGAESGYWSNNANWGNGVSTRSWYPGVFYGETRTVVTNDANNVIAAYLWQRPGAPFIIRGNQISVGRGSQGGDTASIFNDAVFPFILECHIVPYNTDNLLTMNRASNGYGSVVLRGGFTVPGQFKPAGFNSIGGTCSCAELVFAEAKVAMPISCASASASTVSKKHTELTALSNCTLTVSNQQTANSAAGSLWIDEGASVTVNGTWDWNDFSPEHQVNGLLDLNATVGGNATQGFYGRGLLKVKDTDGSDGATMKIGEGITLVPTAASWGTMPLDVASSATISNDSSFVYGVAGGLVVSGPAAELTFDGSGTTVVDAPVAGRAYDIVKKGSGELQLKGSVPGVATRGCRLEVREGTVELAQSQDVFELAAAPGTTIRLGFDNGAPAKLSVASDVDLSGVNVELASGAGHNGYATILEVPDEYDVVGMPADSAKLKFKRVSTPRGGVTLKCKIVRGLMLEIR